jgi:hypothetical protein
MEKAVDSFGYEETFANTTLSDGDQASISETFDVAFDSIKDFGEDNTSMKNGDNFDLILDSDEYFTFGTNDDLSADEMLSGEDDEENESEELGSKQASHMENWEDDEAGSGARGDDGSDEEYSQGNVASKRVQRNQKGRSMAEAHRESSQKRRKITDTGKTSEPIAFQKNKQTDNILHSRSKNKNTKSSRDLQTRREMARLSRLRKKKQIADLENQLQTLQKEAKERMAALGEF